MSTDSSMESSSFPRRRQPNFLSLCRSLVSWIPACAGMTALMFVSPISSPAYADITIGVAGPMTGQYATFGEQMVHGAQAAIDAINSKGGISGEQLRLAAGDDGCDSRKSGEVAKTFVSNGVSVVIGHFCSNAALIGAKIYEAANIPMISPTASLPTLAEAAGWNVVRLASRDDVQGDMAALRIERDRPEAVVAIIDDGTAASKTLAGRFITAYGKAPLVVKIKPDSKDLSALVADLQLHGVDSVYFACAASDAGNIAAALKSEGLAIKYYGSDNLLADQFWVSAKEAGEDTHVTFAIDPQSARQAKLAIESLKIAGFNADGAALPSFAAVQLYAAAAVQVGAHNGKGIADYLRSGKTNETALGALAFDAKGEVQPPRFVWYKWSQGAYSAESSYN
jgi:branched-chain amino acid transport system substrate-binding protein